jgi:hypothetical protein
MIFNKRYQTTEVRLFNISIISKKEKTMGRKGVSKRKPKKSGKNSAADERSKVQNLVRDKSAPASRDSQNPSTGSKKSQ